MDATAGYASRARTIQNELKLNNRYIPEDEIAFLRAQLEEKAATIAALEAQARAALPHTPRFPTPLHPSSVRSAHLAGMLVSVAIPCAPGDPPVMVRSWMRRRACCARRAPRLAVRARPQSPRCCPSPHRSCAGRLATCRPRESCRIYMYFHLCRALLFGITCQRGQMAREAPVPTALGKLHMESSDLLGDGAELLIKQFM